VSRGVRGSDRYLAWIDTKAIAAGFALAVSDTQVTAAADALQALTNHNRWYQADADWHGSFILAPIEPESPRD
jgi:hypothetical protein